MKNLCGIHVARTAGMPSSVVDRANQVLEELERQRGTVSDSPARKGKAVAPSVKPMQLSFFQLDDPTLIEIRDQIKDLDLNNLTHLEALNKLNEIKKLTGL